MYSWAISGSSVFCDLLSVVFSGVSLESIANFPLFLKVAMILMEKFCQFWRLNWSFSFVTKVSISSIAREKRVQQRETVYDFEQWVQFQKAANFYNINSNFLSPIYTFSLAGNMIFYTPNQGWNGERYFIHNIFKGKMPTLAWSKHLSIYLFFHGTRLFHLLTEIVWVQSIRSGHQSG